MINCVNEKKMVDCTGCGACALVCPKDAISYKEDKLGYIIADIDDARCVSCGRCQRVCHRFVNCDSKNVITHTQSYYGWSCDDRVLKKSTSGGIIHEIANLALENGMKVIGVTYDCNENKAKHIIISRKEDLNKIEGSKYLQSEISDTLKSIDWNEKYLVIGTPCQIYGVYQYASQIEKKDNFIFVDFFCHGYPGYQFWRQYLGEIRSSGIEKLQKVEFRCKERGWGKFLIKITGDNGIYYGDGERDLFNLVFLSDATIHESCFSCKFRFDMLYADIRVGDYWGERFLNNTTGVSVITAHSLRGNEILTRLRDSKKIYIDEIEFDELYRIKAGKTRGYKKIPVYHDKCIGELKRDGIISKKSIRRLRQRRKVVQIVVSIFLNGKKVLNRRRLR